MADRIRIEEQLSYHKRNRSVADIVQEEFAFSLLFNNIAPDKMPAALQSVGMSRMPNRFLLIQIDGYYSTSGRASVESELLGRAHILGIVREQLEQMSWEHLAVSLTGTDALIVLLCAEETDDCEETLSLFSQELCEKARHLANRAVSICISDRCDSPAQLSENYETARVRLHESFFLEKNPQGKIIRTAGSTSDACAAEELDRCLQSVYVALSKGDRTLFGQMLSQLFGTLPKNAQGRSQAPILAAWLIDKMEEYALSCGVKEGKYAAAKVAEFKETVRACRHMDDIGITLLACYEMMCELLGRLRGHSADSAFCEMVQQYIKDHYREKIYLEDIAASCGYSKYYFCRQFKKCFGIGLSDSVNHFRVERAKELMRKGYQSVEEIAREVGFSSANYFEIVFRKSEGISPTAFRKQSTPAAQNVSTRSARS